MDICQRVEPLTMQFVLFFFRQRNVAYKADCLLLHCQRHVTWDHSEFVGSVEMRNLDEPLEDELHAQHAARPLEGVDDALAVLADRRLKDV